MGQCRAKTRQRVQDKRKSRPRSREYLSKGDRQKFNMCGSKIKLKSNRASKYAERFNQRKYECPMCGHWHLTSKGD